MAFEPAGHLPSAVAASVSVKGDRAKVMSMATHLYLEAEQDPTKGAALLVATLHLLTDRSRRTTAGFVRNEIRRLFRIEP